MKKARKVEPFNWSRMPSMDGVEKVFLSDPNAYTSFGKSISKEEFAHSLHIHNKITELENNKKMFRDMFFFVLTLIPIFFFIYNITIGVSR
jgi:hypothetical protein